MFVFLVTLLYSNESPLIFSADVLMNVKCRWILSVPHFYNIILLVQHQSCATKSLHKIEINVVTFNKLNLPLLRLSESDLDSGIISLRVLAAVLNLKYMKHTLRTTPMLCVGSKIYQVSCSMRGCDWLQVKNPHRLPPPIHLKNNSSDLHDARGSSIWGLKFFRAQRKIKI